MLMAQQALELQGESTPAEIDNNLVKLLQDLAYTTQSFPYFARVAVKNLSAVPVKGGKGGVLLSATLHDKEMMVKVHRDYRDRHLTKPVMYELFQRECRSLLLWYQLSQRKLRNIVPLEGVTILDARKYSVVTGAVMSRWVSADEWIKSIHDLASYSAMYRKRGFKRLINGIATGLSVLHKNHIVHGDLHLGNILLEVNAHHEITRVMLCDFGMTRMSRKSMELLNSTSPQPFASLKAGYAPPENPEAMKSPETPGDIFSFAISMWHWVHEAPPKSHEAPKGRLSKNIPDSWKEMVIEDEDEGGLYSLARQMTRTDPHRRPTIEIVIQELQQFGYVEP
ncbi:kinase-like protein [Clavulina sp. PMI_390]|nr:kinase-like protein [Clavulina sp. PMI_390]